MSTADDRDPLLNDDHLLKRSLTPTGEAAGPCLDAETLAAWADGSTHMPGADDVERHVASCARCQALLAAFANAEVAEAAYGAASIPAARAAADGSSNVVPFKRVWMRWVPIAVGAVAASLVIYAAWPKGVTPAVPRSDQATASVVPSAQTPPIQSDALAKDETALAKATPSDARAARPTLQAESRKAARQTPAAATPAPAPPPEPLRAPVAVTPPAAAATAGTVALAAPPPPPTTVAAATNKPAELTMLRGANDASSRADAAASRVIAEFGAPTTNPASPAAQPLIGRAAGGGGGARGGGGAGALVATTARATARVSWRVLVSGLVERSINAGQTWAAVTIAPAVAIVNGAAPSANVCWLIGKGGIVLRSTDGVTFRRVASPDVADLHSITAIDEFQATVTTIDGRVFKTEDGGEHWKE